MRGRTRVVKPEIHSDAELWDLEQETGLPIFRAFVGIWNFADREGRFEWKPRQLRALILPFWEGDFSRVLDALATRGFLVAYTVDGLDFGVVRTFRKHQTPNGRESKSELPSPPLGYERFPRVANASASRQPREEHVTTTLHDGMGLVCKVWEGMVGEADASPETPHEPAAGIQVAPDNAQHVPRSPLRFRQLLEDAVRAEFFDRNETPQKAHDSQWRDGCQTVQDALELGGFADASEVIAVFAGLLVDACTDRDRPEKLGFALQQITLAKPSSKPAPTPYRIREGA